MPRWGQVALTQPAQVGPANADTASEIAAFRYRALHVAAQLVRSGRQLHLRIDRHWRWATAIAIGFTRLRTAFA